MKRRELSAALVAAIVCVSWRRRALAAPVHAAAEDWVERIGSLGRALRAGEIEEAQWGEQIGALASSIDVDDVLARTDFERVTAGMRLPDRGAAVHRLRLTALPVAGLALKLFGLRRGCALVPHGHDGIASMHLVLHGRMHGRHYDRITDESRHVLVRPTMDRVHRRGDASTATRDRDNVHWFVARTPVAFAFGAAVEGLGPASRRVYLDPERAEVGPGDVLRMPVLDRGAAMRRYGAARE